jgi:hypothetical protein
MMDSEIAARLTEALVAAAGDNAELISAEITIIARADIHGDVKVTTDRKTRSLLFLSAEAEDANGERIARAASVHKLS